MPDAVSGATPTKGSYVKSWRPETPLQPGSYVVRFEANASYDYSESWPKLSEADVNGQPSVVYSAPFVIAASGTERVEREPFTLVGHGDPLGKDGEVRSDASSLGSALSLVAALTLSLRP